MAKKKIPDLIIEQKEINGSKLLSLIEHRRENYLVVIDNITEDEITAYALDYIEQEGILLSTFLSVCENWHAEGKKHPISFEFSRLGVSSLTKNIFKTFDTAHVTRLIGNPFIFDLYKNVKVKRKKAVFVTSLFAINPIDIQ